MDIVEKNLAIIEECIQTTTYQEVETERFELKDLSRGWGDDWQKSVCAFLNTNGGIIVIGISDKNNSKPPHYKFMGYINSSEHENYLKDTLPKLFKDRDGKVLDLSVNNIFRYEIRPFMSGNVVVVYVESLPDDEKFAYYQNVAYKRRLTGDHPLTNSEIDDYEELKREIITDKELSIVKNATLDQLNIDILNQYILRYNKGKSKGETLKADLNGALSFLTRQGFVRENSPTLLGMLVCGNDVENYIQGKCEADCYVVSPHKVAESKEIINDNIIGLIERTTNYVWRNIKVGVGYSKGGTAEPEYPEELLRESINNAFAHRNYNTDRFVIIEIRPNDSLMIRNPGAFERRQRITLDSEYGKIRRIVPIQVARNPKLTHLLKSFDFWEGKGRGLTSLIDACLENQIDVPYYVLSDSEIKLFIPKGKVYDDEMDLWLGSFAGYISKKLGRELTFDEKIMLSFFYKSERLNRIEQYTILLTMDNNHKDVIATLEENNLIFKNPASPEIYPIYQVDRVLMKKEFSSELKDIYGEEEWSSLKQDYKDVLSAIYRHNMYSSPMEVISANNMGTLLFLEKNKVVNDPKAFENYKRKIRNIFNQLEIKEYIYRRDKKTKDEKGKPDFVINTGFKEINTLFKVH
jgi:ATP-dependent DNA helicase RecG